MTVAGGISALAFGRIRSGLGGGKTPAVGYVFVAAGFGLIGAEAGFAFILVGAALIGLGLGLVMPNFLTAALNAAPEARRGAASGVMTTSIFLGQFASPLISSQAIDGLGYRGAFGLFAIASVVFAASAAWLLKERT